MNQASKWHQTLFGRTALLIASSLFLFQLLILLISAYYVGLPLAQRAAKDLSLLIINISNTLQVLTPENKQTYLNTLDKAHELSVFHTPVQHLKKNTNRLPYLIFLQQHLQQLTSIKTTLFTSNINDETWYWVKFEQSNPTLIGFSEKRIGTKPFLIIAPAITITLILSLISSILLARYLSLPIRKLADATEKISIGKIPEIAINSGPKEIRLLSHNFYKMAKKVNDLVTNRTTLLAGVSHDLRTPLTRMTLALEMLNSSSDPDLILDLKTDIGEMEALIQQFIDFSRGIQFDKEEHNLNLHELVAKWITEVQRHNKHITLDIENPLPTITINPLALQRVFINLLENAIRYSRDLPIIVEIKAKNNVISLNILDQGPGIPADKIEKVFQPFYRINTTRSSEVAGSGLGLSIAKEICTTNKWSVKLKPRIKGGLCAQINLHLNNHV